MTDNRLVKLGNLLESKNRTIRNEAASVLGQIPFTNVYLLPTLRKFLHNTAWDTRVSAALALGYVLKGMPAATGVKVETIPKASGIEDMDLVAVIRDYRSLLCSEGDELSAPSVRISKQQQRLNIDKHLNLQAKIYGSKAFLQDHDIDPSLILPSDKSTCYDKLELTTQLESIEIDPSGQVDAAFGELIKFVVYDMASPKWQMRHGAFLALNEVLTHAFERLPPQWIETLVQRVLEVLALDRFVDFVTGSNSIAPVREAAAQCLCLSLCKLAPDSKLIPHVIRLLKTLLDLSEDSFWQCRQTALLVFKYLFAAMDPVILGDSIIFDVLARMDDTNDEVVSATIVALASLFSNIRLSSEKRRELVNTIMSSVWNKLKQPECLKQLRDGVDSVLTDLVGIVDVYAQVEPNANLSDAEFRIFVDLLDPRLITRTLKILQCLRVSLMKPIELSDATLHQLLKMLYRCCLFVPAADGTPLLDAALNILLQLVDVFGHRFGTLDLLHNTVGYWIGCLTSDEKKAEIDVFALTVDGPTSNPLEPFEYMCGTEIRSIVEAERPNIIIERKIILARFLSPIVDALYHSGKVIREQPVHLSIQFIFHPYLHSALLSQRLGAALMLNCWARMYRRRALRLDIPPLIFPEVAVREAIEALGTPTGGLVEVNNSIQNLHHESNEFLSYCRRHGAKEEDLPDASLANQLEPYVKTALEACMKHCKEQNKPLVKQRYDYILDLIKTTKATMRTHANRVNALLASALCFFNHALPKLSPMIRPLMESIEYEDLPIMAEETLFDAIPIMLTLSADRDPCPHVKMIKNLTLGLVSSEAYTPFPASWVKDGTEEIAVLGDMSFTPDEKFRRAKNCEMVFNACMKTFGPSLFAVCKEFEKYLTLEIDPVNEFEKALERIEVVRVLFHQWKVFPTADQVEVLLKLIAHANPAVRFRVNRLIVEFAKVDVYETMNLFYPGLLIHIGNIDSDAARAGAVELLLLLSKLEDHLVGTTSLLAPIAFSAISDKIECVRDAASGAFRRMVQILPLEKDKAAYVDRYVPSVAAKYKSNLDFLNVLASPGLLPHLGKTDIPALRDDVDLRPYQFEGITWMMFLHKFGLNGILADDMGLGKTLQTLCLLSIVHNSPKEDDEKEIWSLIVCPKTLVNHWCFEWEKYFPNTKHMRRLEELNGNAKHYGPIVVASYDDVRNNAILKAKRWNYIILDEGHCIRNHTTQLFEVISNLIAKHRLILSGTPVQNSPADLWALFRFLMPGYLSTRSAFHQKYIKPMLACRHPKATDQQTKDGEAALQQLHRQVLPFLMRRLKADVLNELPDKVVQDCMCQLTDVQRKLYAAVVDRCTLKRENEGATDESESLSALHTLITLRKLVDHPLLIRDVLEKLQLKEFDVTKAQNHALDLSGKLVALKEILTECQISKDKPAHGEHSDASSDGVEVPSLNQHRALIFCQWRASVDLVAEYLDSGALGSGISYVRLDGTVKPGDRQSVVERFNQDESIDLMLLTTHIGGVGLNLTGADVVIFLDHDWNPVKDLQAIDRAHRLGQRKTVNVYRLITQGSIEEKIMRYQKLKSDTANVLVGADNRSLGSMATDELLELFTLDSGGSSSGGSGDSEPQAKRRKYTAAAARLPAGVPGSSANPADKWSIEDLWDDSQYEEQHSISSFLRKSNL
uniref:TATA-binding protein-associated factor n=1 Tax=Panagrellus redivivus TaxID=6233 RepID=A0A7E4ZXR5_PANRE